MEGASPHYLVTGGAGFIGSHLVEALATRGRPVAVLDDLSTGRRENIQHLLDSGQVKFVEGSVLDQGLVDDCMRSVDVCFHLASAVGVRLIVERPLDSLLNTVRGTELVMASAAAHGLRLVYTSTSEVYGKSNAELREDSDRIMGSPFKSRWAYATAKSFGETLAHGYFKERGTETVVTRLFNTVGSRQTGSYGMVLPRFVRQALRGEDLTVYGNGTQTRCFTHVLDTVHALVLLANSDGATGRVYNVGSRSEIPIVELARRVIDRTGSRSTVKLVPYTDAYGPEFEELGRRVPDTSALEELTGWKPSRTVDEAIDDVISSEASASAGNRVSGRIGLAS